MLWKMILQELNRTTAIRPGRQLKFADHVRLLQITLFSLSTAAILGFAFTSPDLHLSLPIRQLHLAWNLTRVLIEF